MSRKLLVLIPVSALMLSLLIGGIISGHAQMSQGGFNVKDGVLISYEGTESAVSIPGGVTAIGRQAFENNRFITSVSIPSSVTKIDYAAFAGCTALQSIDIPDSVTKLEDSVFRGCSALNHAGLGKNVYEMGAGVFGDCDSLSAVTIDPGNQYFAMYGGGLYDSGLKKLYQFLSGSSEVVFNAPVSVKEIGKYAFWGADYLEVVAVPAVERISDYAFTNAEGLRFVTIQTPTNEIGVKAFEDCRSLEQIVTPISLKKIHETAFDGVPKSAVFVCEEGSSAYNWATEHGFLQSADAREVAVVTTREAAVPTPIDFAELSPAEAAESINGGGNTGGGGTAAAVQDGVLLGGTTVVSDRAYLDVDGIAVKEGSAEPTPVPFNGDIPAYAHYRDESLSRYSFEDYEFVKNIGEFAYARSYVSEALIPEGTQTIGKGAFYHCDRLTAVEIPGSVTRIEAHAFDHTPFMEKWKADKTAGDWLIVGDGVAIAYKGNESEPQIPAEVKYIAEGVLNKIPDGEEAAGSQK